MSICLSPFQLMQTVFDQVVYGAKVPGVTDVLPPNATPTELLAAVRRKYSLVPPHDGTMPELTMTHLTHYGGGYYTYL